MRMKIEVSKPGNYSNEEKFLVEIKDVHTTDF